MAYKIGDEEKDFKFIGEYATIESVYSLYPRGGCTGMWFTHTGDGNKRYNWSEFYNQWVPEDFVFPDPQNPTPIVEYLKGANGKNAYELAVENGFSGSLTEWLASLKGNAENGKSAYELAVAAGYSGTLEEWLESFVSPYSLAALFLSAKDDDTAEGKITFEKGLDVKDRIASDNFVEGALGHRTTKEGDAELKSLKVREFIETPELRKNRISVNGNEFWFTDVCVVESIEQQLNPDHFIIHPRLLEGDLLSFHSSDILRGIFSYGDGFYTCVLQVVVVHEDLKSMEVVTLNGRQPRAAMVLARQTNAVDTDRQGSIYADGLNKYIRVINGYDPENPGELGNIANLKLQIGDLSGINHPAFGQLSGYGLFAANVYLLGTIMQASWDGSQYMRPSFWRGVYNPLTLYGPGETVSFVKPGYGESTWICKKPTKGNDPSNTEFWDPYVSGGKTGAPGAPGMNSYTAVLYQRSADSPVPAKPSDSLLYNFVTKELTDPLGVLGAWSIGIPAVNGLPLWVITATVASRTDTDTIETGDWSLPSMQLKDGEDGDNGVSIIHQGSYASVTALIAAKGALQNGWSYYNTTDKKSYVYYAPTWYVMASDGLNAYFHRAWADDASGTNFSLSYYSGALYMGTYSDNTLADSTDYEDYTWSRIKGEDGPQGRDGITIRITEWSPGFEYHNDEALTSGMRYLDVVTVSSGTTQTRHLCKVTHTSSLANKPSTTESTEWQTFNQMAPIYTPMLISPHAVLDFLQGQKILLRDASGNIKGLVSSEGDGATGWVFMAGSDDPETAPFKVNQLGQVFMDSLFIRTAASGARLEIDSSSMGIKMYDGNGILKGSYLPAPVEIIDEDNIGTPTVVNSSPASLTADTASVSINYAETPISKTDTIEPANTVTITGAGTWMLTTPAVSYSVSGGSTYGSYSIRVWLIKNGTNLYNAGSRSGKGSASGTIPAGNIAGMTAGVYTIRIDVTMNEEYNTCSASASIGSGNNFYASSVVTKNEIGTDGFNFIKSPTDYVLNSNGTFVSRKGKMRLEASDTKVEARNLTTNKLVLAPLDADECVPVINTHGLICAGNVSSGGTISNKYGLNSSATPNDPVGTYVITHGFGSSAYSVNIVPFNSSAWLMWRVTARATTSFTVQFATTAGTATNTAFDFQMFAMR